MNGLSAVKGMLLVAMAIGASGCGLLIRHPSPPALSSDAHVLAVPLQKQTAPNLCGVVTITMLADYYQRPLSAGQITSLKAYAIAHNGLPGSLIQATLSSAGYYAVIYPGALDHSVTGAYTNIDKGRPSIVLLKSTIDGSTHFSILSGYDPDKHYVILSDPVVGLSIMNAKDFMVRWRGAGRFTLLAVPKPSS